jgi:hypothetical protein
MAHLVDDIMAYEGGELDEEQTIDLFQRLLNSGMVWQLQGSYGRQAQRLIDAGLIHYPADKPHKD